MYIVCSYAKLKSLVTRVALQQIRGADAVSKEHISTMHNIECTYKMQWYTIATLGLVILDLMIFIVINIRKLRLFRGHVLKHSKDNVLNIRCPILCTSEIVHNCGKYASI